MRSSTTLGASFPVIFQVDPTEPSPARGRRWVMVVTGTAVAVLGGLLLLVFGLVTSVGPSGGSACGTGSHGPGCGSPVVTWVFLVPGLLLLVGGCLTASYALWRALRGPGRSSRPGR